MGERESRDDIRELATLEAKRQALEQAGAYLQTVTIVKNYQLASDEVIAVTAGVLATKQANEEWSMEGIAIIVQLTYEIIINTDDVERKIAALLKNREKLDDMKRLQAENQRLLAEMEKLKRQMENANKDEIAGFKQKRKQLSDEFTASEWFEKGYYTDNLNQKITFYSNAIELNPNYADAYNNRGFAYKNKGDHDRAIYDYNRVLEIDPNYAFAYNNRGNANRKKGDNDRAISDYNRALEIDPNLALAYNNRGWVYYLKGDYDRAISDYTKAIEIDPNYSIAYYNRGSAYKKKGDKDNARKDFEKAKKMGHPKAQAELDKLK